MTNAERQKLGLFGLIKQQQEDNRWNEYLTKTRWPLYGDRKQKTDRSYVRTRRMLSGYQKDFQRVLYGIPLTDFVSERQDLVVVDIMGPTDVLAELSSQSIMQVKNYLGIAVSFEDRRNKEKKVRDKSLNIFQIRGDVMDNRTWRKVKKRLKGRKADLIMERADGGLSCIPNYPTFYAAMLIKIWSLLNNKNGMFVGQMRNLGDTFSNQVIDYLQKNNVDILIKGEVVRVIKTPSSPEDIGPILRKLQKPKGNYPYGYSLSNSQET